MRRSSSRKEKETVKHSHLNFAPREVSLEKRSDGTLLLRSPDQLGLTARCVTEWLDRWAREAPRRDFLCERKGDGWRRGGYLEAFGAPRILRQALLHMELGPERPVAILSHNRIDHAPLGLGRMPLGIPVL